MREVNSYKSWQRLWKKLGLFIMLVEGLEGDSAKCIGIELNLRMTLLQAAILYSQLRRLEEFLKQLREN